MKYRLGKKQNRAILTGSGQEVVVFNEGKEDLAALVCDLLNKNSSSFIADIRQAIADYMRSEGCSCCQDTKAHKKHEKRLAELLKVEMYDDESGYNFSKYRSKQ